MTRDQVVEAFNTSLRYARGSMPLGVADGSRLEGEVIYLGIEVGLARLSRLHGELLSVLAQRPLDALPIVFTRAKSADLVRERREDHAAWLERVTEVADQIDRVRLVLDDYAAGLEAQRLEGISRWEQARHELDACARELNAAHVDIARLQLAAE